jgi:hypothetical protein
MNPADDDPVALSRAAPSPAPPPGKNTKKTKQTKQTTEEPLPHVPVTTTKNTIQITAPQADQHVVNF